MVSTDGVHHGVAIPRPDPVGATIDSRVHDGVILSLAGIADAAALLRQLHRVGVRAAWFGAAHPVGNDDPAVTGASELFDVIVDSATTPDPAVFTDIAHRLDTRPERCVLIADNTDSAHACRNAGFRLIIGIADTAARAASLHRLTDVTVGSLNEISVRTGDQRIPTLPDALRSFEELRQALAFRTAAVLLDFDGTVSAIVNDPAAAALTPGAAQALQALAAHCPLAVISGRDLSDIRQRVGLHGIWYAASHGADILAPDGTHHRTHARTETAHLMRSVAAQLDQALHGIAGVTVEPKTFSVAVHYRNASGHDDDIVAAADIVGRRNGVRVTGGRKLIELRPNAHFDKGSALRWVIQHMTATSTAGAPLLPVYIGDDLTDEDAFDAVRYDGIGIVVAQEENMGRATAARYRLDSPHTVTTLLEQLCRQLSDPESTDPTWSLDFNGFDPHGERLREALCAVGNGYFASRGACPQSRAGSVHYPGTYAAGLYNRLTDTIAGHSVTNESLVNLPNWLPVTFRFGEGAWFDIANTELLSYQQSLDMRNAVLTRRFRFRDETGHTTTIVERRIVAMHQPHAAALQLTLTAENWSGPVEFRSCLDAGVGNNLVDRYRDLSSTHLAVSDTCAISTNSVLLSAVTTQSHIGIAIAARTTAWAEHQLLPAHYQLVTDPNSIGHDISVQVEAGKPITLEKVACLFTSRDHAICEPATEATRFLPRIGSYRELADGHTIAWAQLWEKFTIELDGAPEQLRIVRLHMLHLLQTLSPHTRDLDVGVPARGLHGEAYRGHVFWDELFVAPVFTLRQPALTRALLAYRYRRLTEARRAAHDAGFCGAMFPWQSASSGREESPQLHLNPRSGRWNPDPSDRAHHVGLAVAYNIWQYYQATGDVDYLTDYGAEMMLEIARFWVGLSWFDDDRGRYVIRGVIGPDEFHSGYPGRLYDGIDNNAYTNVMAVWVITRALEALALLRLSDRRAVLEKLGLSSADLTRWHDVTVRMFVPFHDGVISQFEGYELLGELDWEAYRQRYGNIQRLDRILEAENDNVNHYKASKQADALMLFYLLSADEIREVLGRLGYAFTPEQIPATIDYYLQRTSHGSTLSAVVHTWVLARAHRDRAMEFFTQALHSDVADIQGGTTAEGIHLAAMAGSIDLLQRCFTGLETRSDRLVLGPLWPESLGVLSLPIHYRGHRLHVQIRGSAAIVSAATGTAAPITVECRGRVHQLCAGGTIEVS